MQRRDAERPELVYGRRSRDFEHAVNVAGLALRQKRKVDLN